MNRPRLALHVILCFALIRVAGLAADYSGIPRIDVHAHVGTIENMSSYMAARKALQEKYGEDLALWINVQTPLGLRGEGLPWLKEVEEMKTCPMIPPGSTRCSTAASTRTGSSSGRTARQPSHSGSTAVSCCAT